MKKKEKTIFKNIKDKLTSFFKKKEKKKKGSIDDEIYPLY
tara:strand:- start:478 stop:597 length:120 start_codon:yes stop_codon:yes gene_type:complete